MAGLTLFLAQRTALEAGDPVGVDPARDELAFFPLIYWPIVPGAPKPPQDAHQPDRRLHEAGRHGAVRYPRRHRGAAGRHRRIADPGHAGAARILSSLDVPELEPVPRDHVLTKTFYLLRDFPGRFNTGQTWVEALPRERGRRSRVAPGARRRRRLADHHHLQRSRRRLGAAAGRPADAAADRRANRGSANSPSAPASTS